MSCSPMKSCQPNGNKSFLVHVCFDKDLSCLKGMTKDFIILSFFDCITKPARFLKGQRSVSMPNLSFFACDARSVLI